MRGVSFTAAKMTYMLSLMGMMCWLRLGTASLERSGACAGAGEEAHAGAGAAAGDAVNPCLTMLCLEMRAGA